MTGKEASRDSRTSQIQTHPSETEVPELLQEAASQYEEYMRLADLADISESGEVRYPRYSWDNPVGLVLTG